MDRALRRYVHGMCSIPAYGGLRRLQMTVARTDWGEPKVINFSTQINSSSMRQLWYFPCRSFARCFPLREDATRNNYS